MNEGAATIAPEAEPKPKPKRVRPSRAKPKDEKPAAKPKEINPETLETSKARKRLGAIYKLERNVERKKAAFDLASRSRRAAKAELEQAEEDLEKEIREQRFGPGPLFNADGSGPAGTAPKKAKSKS